MPALSRKQQTIVTEPTPESPIVRSALWAAWADALGFPCELVDDAMLRKRIPSGFNGKLHAWTRRIGGRMGAMVELPAGCISDDTQLRLATSRCIRSSGRFDAEAFSKIELPVFLSYQLGAGRGTKAAAQSLTKRDKRWYSNFYSSAKGPRYIDCGGNGAAMRIQPHVWAAHKGKADVFLGPLLRDTVATHGHLVGILGAALHGVSLWTTLREKKIPDPSRWLGMVTFLEVVDKTIEADDTLGSRWLPRWEQETGHSFSSELTKEIRALSELVQTAIEHADRKTDDPRRAYAEIATKLGGMDPKTRGAGTISAVLALWLAWVHQSDPATAVEMSAGCLGSDTDTVATMVGALVGAVAPTGPPELPMDATLITDDALRLERLSQGEALESFPHPDTLHWQAPSSQADSFGLLEKRPAVTGLGFVQTDGTTFDGQGKNGGTWQWVETEYGQTLLIKRRKELSILLVTSAPRHRPAPTLTKPVNPVDDPRARRNERAHQAPSDLPVDPAEGLELLVARKLDSRLLGQLALHYAQLGTVPSSAFAILLAEHLRDRPKEAELAPTSIQGDEYPVVSAAPADLGPSNGQETLTLLVEDSLMQA